MADEWRRSRIQPLVRLRGIRCCGNGPSGQGLENCTCSLPLRGRKLDSTIVTFNNYHHLLYRNYSLYYYFFREIPTEGNLVLEISTDACQGSNTEINYLEHVQAVVTLNSTRRGDVTMYLISPTGTRSVILSRRPKDDDPKDGFTNWPFMTTHTWGENPRGKWRLVVRFQVIQ